MMDVLINLGLTAVGITMLCVGADRLVGGAASLATRFGISSFIIGMTVVAYGTSTPELAASIQAATSHNTDIILGNVVGSNIAHIGMVVGVAAILGGVAVCRRILYREVPVMVACGVLLAGVSHDGAISWYDGAIMLACLAGFTLYTIRRARPAYAGRPESPNTDHAEPDTAVRVEPHHTVWLLKHVAYVGVGLGLLYVGSILTIDNAVATAEWFGVPSRVIGITVIAVGTSLPELITTVVAMRRGQADIGVANIIGSNILNVLLIVGISSAITEIAVTPVVFSDYIIMIAFSVSLFAAMRSGGLGRRVGVGLAGAYCMYLAASLMLG